MKCHPKPSARAGGAISGFRSAGRAGGKRLVLVQTNLTSQQWKGAFENHELNHLHAEGFGDSSSVDWLERVTRHSLGWVCARDSGDLIGFVNVAWDGGMHAFLLDTVVASRLRGQGVGAAMVATAVRHVRAAGCEWLHVDFEAHLSSFYIAACGFRETRAALFNLASQNGDGTAASRRSVNASEVQER